MVDFNMNRRTFYFFAIVFPFLTARAIPALFGAKPNYQPKGADSPTCFEGRFERREYNDSASFTINKLEGQKFHIQGFSFWGTKRTSGPNIGEIDLVCDFVDGRLVCEEYDPICEDRYQLEITADDRKMTVVETGDSCRYGLNVTFDGEYRASTH